MYLKNYEEKILRKKKYNKISNYFLSNSNMMRKWFGEREEILQKLKVSINYVCEVKKKTFMLI
jgi:hypothetical protein